MWRMPSRWLVVRRSCVFVGGWLAGARGVRAASQSSGITLGGGWCVADTECVGCVGALLGVWDGTWLLFLAWPSVIAGVWLLWCGCVV